LLPFLVLIDYFFSMKKTTVFYRSSSLIISLCFLLFFPLVAQGQQNQRTQGISRQVIEPSVQSELHSFDLVRMVENLDRPWAVGFLPDGTYLITERPGRLVLVSGTGRTIVQNTPEVAAVGQGGMLDLLIDPNFSENQRIFFTFAQGTGNRLGLSVASAQLDVQEHPRLRNLQILWQTPSSALSGGGQHFGSRLVLDNDGYLYVTMGDRGTMERSQNPADPAGSILRLQTNGVIPTTNPFVNRTSVNARGQSIQPLPEVFAYGTRNAQGMAIDWQGKIWFHEHGPRGGDELNLVSPGVNYGWPAVTHGVNYSGTSISSLTSMDGVEDPLVVWTPSIAPSGFTFYSGSRFNRWNSSAFLGALAGQHLRRLEFNQGKVVAQEVLFQNTLGRIRDVRVGSQGFLYILTDGPNGMLYRLE
jgi:glucose/arabinose dehydrogenase